MTPPVLAAPTRALVRAVPESYARCLRSDPAPVDPGRARAQVEGYARTLEELGVAVDRLPADEASPDCCFPEDTALVLSARLAVLARPGAPSRQGEVPPVAEALRARVTRVVALDDAAATLDGGDVLRLGQRLFVGLSARTNRAGAASLARAAAAEGLSVVEVPVAAGLHLKSAVTAWAPGRLVVLAGALDLAPFLAAGAECLETDEPAGGNVLALGGVVLVSRAAPRTAELLARRGVQVRPVEVGELHKGDGALTCLSLRIPPPGAWCA